jgi:hypothetical protein
MDARDRKQDADLYASNQACFPRYLNYAVNLGKQLTFTFYGAYKGRFNI